MRKKFLFSILLFCGTLLSLNAQNTQWETNGQRHYRRATELLEKQKYGAASRSFDRYLASEDANELQRVNAEYYKANCALNLDQPVAEQMFQDFVQEHPHHPLSKRAYFDLGNYYWNKKKWEKAIQYYEEADLDLLSAEEEQAAKFNLAYAYYQDKQVDKAAPLFNVLKHDVKKNKYTYASAYYSGVINEKKGNYPEALADFDIAGENATYKAVVPYMKSLIYYKQSENKDKLLEYAIPLLESNQKVKDADKIAGLVGSAYFDREEYEKATKYLEEYAKKGKKDPELLYRLGYSNLQLGNNEEAAESLKQVASSEDSLGQFASYYLGEAYLALDNKQYALSALEAASRADFHQGVKESAMFDLGKLHYEQGNYDRSIKTLKNFEQTFPNSKHGSESKELLAQSYRHTNDYEEAIKYIESLGYKSESIKEAYQEVTFRRGTEMFNKSRTQEAMDYFTKSIGYPYDKDLLVQAYFWRAETKSRRYMWDEAKNDYAAVFRNAEANSEYHLKSRYGIGYSYFNAAGRLAEQGDAQASQEQYRKALQHFEVYAQKLENQRDRQHYGNALLRIGDCNFLLRDYDQALKSYDKAIASGRRGRAYAHLRKAEVLGRQGNVDEASKNYDIVIQEFGESPYRTEATYKKANLSYENQRFADASKHFTFFINKEKNSELIPLAYLKRGISYQNRGDEKLALEDMETILSLYCTNPAANDAIQVARELLIQPGSSDNTKINRYNKLEDDYASCNPNSETTENLVFDGAVRFFYDGHYDQAVGKFENFLDKYPKSKKRGEALYFLGDSYYSLENYDEAERRFEELLKEGAGTNYMRTVRSLARLNAHVEDYPDSKTYHEKWLEVVTSQSQQRKALQGLMESCYALGQYDSTKTFADQLIAAGGHKPEASLYKAKANYKKGNLDLAYTGFVELMQTSQDENGAEANYMAGKVLYDQEKYSEAIDTLARSSDHFMAYPEWVGNCFLLIGESYESMNEDFQARETYQSLVDYFPGGEVVDEAKRRIKMLDDKEAEARKEKVQEIDLESGKVEEQPTEQGSDEDLLEEPEELDIDDK